MSTNNNRFKIFQNTARKLAFKSADTGDIITKRDDEKYTLNSFPAHKHVHCNSNTF